jgi:hypothetical protein
VVLAQRDICVVMVGSLRNRYLAAIRYVWLIRSGEINFHSVSHMSWLISVSEFFDILIVRGCRRKVLAPKPFRHIGYPSRRTFSGLNCLNNTKENLFCNRET